MLGINRNTLRSSFQKYSIRPPSCRQPELCVQTRWRRLKREGIAGPYSHENLCGRPAPHDHPKPASAHFRLRQDRARRFRARPGRARNQAAVDRRDGQSAGRCGLPVTESAPTPAFRKCSTAASKRCIPRCTAAFSRAAICPSTLRRLKRTAFRPSIWSSSICIRSARRSPSPVARSTTRSRTSISAGRPWCAPRRRTGSTSALSSIPPTTRPLLDELRANNGDSPPQRAFAWRKRRFRTPPPTTAPSATISPRMRRRRHRTLSRNAQLQGRRCRTCATARTRTSRRRSIAICSPSVAGTIATYRQLQGKELSYNNIADADAAWECVKTFAEPACVIVKHANPCGVAIAGDAARGLSSRLRHRSDVGLRRHHRLQSRAGRRTARGRRQRQFLEVLIAPGVTCRRWRASRRRPTCACSKSLRDRAGAALGHQARRRRPAGANRRQRSTSLPTSRWSPKSADRRNSCATCCLPGAWPSSSSPTPSCFAKDGMTRGRRRRPDEPRRFGAHRRHQGRRTPACRCRLGGRLGRLLPVPRRPRRRGRRRAPSRSSSRAAACATTKSSPPPTSAASPWCSPACGISGIEQARRGGRFYACAFSSAR